MIMLDFAICTAISFLAASCDISSTCKVDRASLEISATSKTSPALACSKSLPRSRSFQFFLPLAVSSINVGGSSWWFFCA